MKEVLIVKKKFVRHFRVYFVNGHPAYIVDEDGDDYLFHRTTHSKTSGGRTNWEKKNPINDGDMRKLYIVKKEQKDKKGRFSLFELELKPGVDISYPDIKKASDISASLAGSTQTNERRADIQTSKDAKRLNHKGNQASDHNNDRASKSIKPKRRKKHKRNKKR